MRSRTPPRTSVLPGVIVSVLCLLSAGCGGGSEVRCYGILTKGGKPLDVGPGGKVVIAFVDQSQTDRHVAYCEPDGTFELDGKINGGILPGTYHLHISQFDPYPTRDLLERKFSGENALVREVTGGRIEIDLDNPGQQLGQGKATPHSNPAAKKAAETKGQKSQKGQKGK